MGKWIEQQDLKKEKKEKSKIRREKIAGYFLNLSQLTFVALVLGGVTPLYLDVAHVVNWFIMCTGLVMTYAFAAIGNIILKQ